MVCSFPFFETSSFRQLNSQGSVFLTMPHYTHQPRLSACSSDCLQVPPHKRFDHPAFPGGSSLPFPPGIDASAAWTASGIESNADQAIFSWLEQAANAKITNANE
jgi:hypothetical protein